LKPGAKYRARFLERALNDAAARLLDDVGREAADTQRALPAQSTPTGRKSLAAALRKQTDREHQSAKKLCLAEAESTKEFASGIAAAQVRDSEFLD